ncbi:MAG: hypothetical protein AB7L92_08165 [Alphaproteobacteria bacterium]
MLFGNKHSRDRKETAGEVAFDRVVYTGIGFALNELLGLALAVEMRHFGGKNTFDKATRWWQKTRGHKDMVQNGVRTPALTLAADQLEIFTLLTSGTLLIVPMKLLEDNKAKIVKNFNHVFDKLHETAPEQIKERDEEVEKAIACQPKQTWGTMILGRAIATAHNTFLLKETLFAGSRTQTVRDVSKKYIDKSVSGLHKISGSNLDSRLLKIQKTERYKRYSEVIGLDTLYTIVSSVVLELTSKFFASKKPQVKNPELCAIVEKEKQEKERFADHNPGQPPVAAASRARRAGHKKLSFIEPAASHTQRLAEESNEQLQPGI